MVIIQLLSNLIQFHQPPIKLVKWSPKHRIQDFGASPAKLPQKVERTHRLKSGFEAAQCGERMGNIGNIWGIYGAYREYMGNI